MAEQATWHPFSGPAAAEHHAEYIQLLTAEEFVVEQRHDEGGPRLYLYGTAEDARDAWSHLFCQVLAQRRLELGIVHSLERVELPEPRSQ